MIRFLGFNLGVEIKSDGFLSELARVLNCSLACEGW